jgi:glycosyltransferase involved in cell wall biosynthesis
MDERVIQIPPLGGRLEATLSLARILRREKPDVSISAISACNLRHAVAATLVGRRNRAIMTYHGHVTAEPELSNQIGYWATSITSRLVARTVAVSDGLRRHMVEDWGSSPRKTVRIYNPTLAGNPDTAAKTEAELLSREPIVLSAGSFLPRKNFPALVRAFAHVKTTGARLVVLGEGRMRGDIEAEIARLGLGDRVTLTGYQREPWAFYRQARCFAFASKEESFGLVLVEALGQGLPVIVTPSDGPNEIMSDPRYGELVAHDDPLVMAAAIDRALTAPGDPRPRLARAADYSVDVGLDNYEAMIEEVAAEAERGRAVSQLGAVA